MSTATLTGNKTGDYEIVDTCNQKIVAAAYMCLDCHPHFHGRNLNLRITCHESVLTVRGRLPTFYLKQLLQVALLKLDGVSTIQNDIVVFNPGDPLCNYDA